MSSRASAYPSASATPAPSSPRVSESYLSDLDGTASVIDGGDFDWDSTKVDPTTLNLVSWKLDVNARAGDGVDKRGFNGEANAHALL
jgi:vacuolar protein sorting-associated protein 54